LDGKRGLGWPEPCGDELAWLFYIACVRKLISFLLGRDTAEKKGKYVKNRVRVANKKRLLY
jgi:hypothetical protein